MGLFTDILKGLPENAVLRSKIEEIEAKYAAIDTENGLLKEDKRQLELENRRLQTEIEQVRKAASTSSDELHEIEKAILVAFGKYGSLDSDEMGRALNIPQAKASFYLQELQDKKLARWLGINGSCNLTQAGRKYLIDNDLI